MTKSKPLLSSVFSSSVLFVLSIVIVIPLIIWASIAAFSEGQKELPSLKIISPTNGQNISIGSNLTISGISTGTNTSAIGTNNNSNNRCHISIIVNNIRPYQDATADGPNGANDYSRWHLTVSPASAIKEGENKITSKLSCLPAGSNVNSTNSTITNNLIKWYSVNVTGVLTSQSSQINKNNQTITNATTQHQQQPLIQHQQQPSPLPASTSKSKSYNPKPMSISIQSSQNIVNVKGESIMSAIAYDAISGKKIDNAILKMKITFNTNGTTKEISSHNGEITYSSQIKPNSKNNIGDFKATVQASAPGYNSAFKAAGSASASASTSTSGSASASTSTSGSASATVNTNH
ncbi:MAG TPA: hypothetical protein VEL70_01970 [Candidatus Acidoferrum sp.]|nr:hypothetical protein [Candidatus Acidoferrum sp.]